MLGAIGFAAMLERIQVFHCKPDFNQANAQERLTTQLEALTKQNVLTSLVVDAATASDRFSSAAGQGVETVVLSDRWAGPVIVPIAENVQEAARTIAALDVWRSQTEAKREIITLSLRPAEMIEPLRKLLVAERGRVMRNGAPAVPQVADRPPVVGGVGATQR